MSIGEEIRSQLEAVFDMKELIIRDDSEQHRGHSGWREGGETHFHVSIKSSAFESMSRLEKHRAIHTALGKELLARIHALSLDISA